MQRLDEGGGWALLVAVIGGAAVPFVCWCLKHLGII